MPSLDVTEVLFDPDFFTSLVYQRRTQTVGDDGMAVSSKVDTPFSGVVSSNSKALRRFNNGERISGRISIHTTTRLSDGKQGVTADIVTWRGSEYTVIDVGDYGEFGRGFYACICDLITVSG